MPKAVWYTPVARQKNLTEMIKKIENNGWKVVPMPLEPQISYFDNKQKFTPMLGYDQFFAYTKTFPLWDPKKRKDNVKYLPTIWENIARQEGKRLVPALTSLNYGKATLKPYDEVESVFKRSCGSQDFYRRRGVLVEDTQELA